MEVFKCNKKNNKWYKRIDYIKLLLVLVISFSLFYVFFYYIGGKGNSDNALLTASIMTLLVLLLIFFNDLIENRDKVILLDDDKIGYIELHKEISGKFLRSYEFEETIKKEDIEKIYTKNHLFEGVDKGEIIKVLKVKKKANCLVIKAKVKAKEWKSTSRLVISNPYLVNKEYIKRIIIPNDFDNYNRLYKILSNMK